MVSIKEHSIREYISKIDFRSDELNFNTIKEDMRKFLGEEPAIDVLYKRDVMLNEVTGEAKEFSDINKIQIIFTDIDNKFKKLEFIVDKNY